MPGIRSRVLAGVWIFLHTGAAQTPIEVAARKILTKHCWACHSQSASGNLRLDSQEAIRRGGKSGPVIVPGDAAGSHLYQAISHTSRTLKPMPPDGSLSQDEVTILKNWINDGAPWSENNSHWAFRPLHRNQQLDSVDQLINVVLRGKGLTPAPRADKRTLIRRIYVDLLGLPPSEAEFTAAYDDNSPDWFQSLVTKLLGSHHFGEKWGRHWLDVARYGEDDFSGTQVMPYANAWRYRDWVVQALNQDMPYDRFLMAQLAGDLMNDASLLPATGLLGLGPWYYGIAQPAQSRADERNDRVDVVSRGMLGVTVACARCHDHKYDPFTAKDYYALAGVFASTAYKEYPLVPEAEAAAWKKQKEQVDAAEKSLKKFLDDNSSELGERFGTHIASYMMAVADPTLSATLHPKVLDRWKAYLAKPEESYPFLKAWFNGQRTSEEAASFQRLMLAILAEKKKVDAENAERVQAAKKNEPKILRTIVLPGGYRSEEDFNPGAYVPSRSLQRDRFVAYNKIFGEASAPLKFDPELTVELLPLDRREEYLRLKEQLEKSKKALPPQYAYFHGVGESEPWDLNLNIRGNPEALGEIVPRRFPIVLSGDKEIGFDQGSGRLQLADTVAHHPLAARVAVNRIWLALFGQGLVRTPSNFGRVGDRPVLPDLLEFLAARFVEKNYSMKAIISEIVLSEAYMRSSAGNPANEKIDSDNRYVWRQGRRRLDAETLRDAMLAVSGELESTLGGESRPLTADFRRRTLYAKMSRFQQDETLSLFDLPSASVTCEQRAVTNVPMQKLFFLNSDTVKHRALSVGKRIENANTDAGITSAYRLLFQRSATDQERRLGRAFIEQGGTDSWSLYAQVLLSSNEFAYVD